MDDFDFIPKFVPSVTTSTAAPKLDDFDIPQEEVRRPRKTSSGKKASREAAFRKMIIATLIEILVLGMLSSVIFVNSKIVDNNGKISQLQADISQEEAENVRLNTYLSARVSADKIQEYAVTVLGMQKAERYQIHYFDVRDGDRVVIAGGKALNADAQG